MRDSSASKHLFFSSLTDSYNLANIIGDQSPGVGYQQHREITEGNRQQSPKKIIQTKQKNQNDAADDAKMVIVDAAGEK